MKLYKNFVFSFFLFSNFCIAQVTEQSYSTEDSLRKFFSAKISKARLQQHVEVLASDSLEGRETGTLGQKKAKDYILSNYQTIFEIDSSRLDGFLQKFKFDDILTENVVLQINGDTYKDEYIVVSAHYDHVGKEGRNIYNGADDNASGSAAVLELARVFQTAWTLGLKPKRNIIFIHFSAEELGLYGSKVFMNYKSIDNKNIKADLNADMIGRVDNAHRKDNHYVYIIGADYFGDDLKNILEEVNKETDKLELNYAYNSTDHPEQFYRRTDSFPFSEEGIPFVFFTSGVHKDYHQPSDTADKIDYNALTYRTRLLFALTWELANRDEKIEIDPLKVIHYQKMLKKNNWP